MARASRATQEVVTVDQGAQQPDTDTDSQDTDTDSQDTDTDSQDTDTEEQKAVEQLAAQKVEPEIVAPTHRRAIPNNTWTLYYGGKTYDLVEGQERDLPMPVFRYLARSGNLVARLD